MPGGEKNYKKNYYKGQILKQQWNRQLSKTKLDRQYNRTDNKTRYTGKRYTNYSNRTVLFI